MQNFIVNYLLGVLLLAIFLSAASIVRKERDSNVHNISYKAIIAMSLLSWGGILAFLVALIYLIIDNIKKED